MHILEIPDAGLRAVAEPVAQVDDAVRTLIDDMLETMYAAPGRGLAAPQVGVLKRVFVMDVDWKDGPRNPVVMINPEVLWRSDDIAPGWSVTRFTPNWVSPPASPSRCWPRPSNAALYGAG